MRCETPGCCKAFHGGCIGVHQFPDDLPDDWICPICAGTVVVTNQMCQQEISQVLENNGLGQEEFLPLELLNQQLALFEHGKKSYVDKALGEYKAYLLDQRSDAKEFLSELGNNMDKIKQDLIAQLCDADITVDRCVITARFDEVDKIVDVDQLNKSIENSSEEKTPTQKKPKLIQITELETRIHEKEAQLKQITAEATELKSSIRKKDDELEKLTSAFSEIKTSKHEQEADHHKMTGKLVAQQMKSRELGNTVDELGNTVEELVSLVYFISTLIHYVTRSTRSFNHCHSFLS